MIEIKADKFGLLIDKSDVTKALRTIGKEIKANTKAAIMHAGAGVAYGSHKASAPGEAPANLTGKLAASLKVSVRGSTLKVTDTAKYALALESGSQGGGRGKGGKSGASTRSGKTRTATTDRTLEARPYLSAELEQMKPEIEAKLDAAFETIIKARSSK